jgi:hypothetical protein
LFPAGPGQTGFASAAVAWFGRQQSARAKRTTTPAPLAAQVENLKFHNISHCAPPENAAQQRPILNDEKRNKEVE